MWRSTWWNSLLATVALIVAVATAANTSGCDRPRPQAANPQPQEPAQPAATQASLTVNERPTTQQLLTGEYVRVPLRAIPFSVTVPKGWEIKAQAGILTLEGPTLAGTAQIQISRHLAPIPQHAERLIEGAKREVAANRSPYGLAEVRTLSGDIRYLEYRSVSPNPTGSPTIDSTGRQIAPTATPMQWKLTAFLVRGKDTDLCELSLIDFTREQFEMDREVLEKIFASFEYDPQAASS
jgi:hypothetical protein